MNKIVKRKKRVRKSIRYYRQLWYYEHYWGILDAPLNRHTVFNSRIHLSDTPILLCQS